MNKVITINLNGIAYQLEERGYEALRAYLDNAARRLEGNPDKDEILADIEQAIADKFRAALGAYKTVVNTKEVESVIAEMGPVQDATAGEAAAGAAAQTAAGSQAHAGGADPASDPKPVRRLYRIHDGAMLSGVCNGLGAYFGIDPTIVRIGFVVLTFFWGAGVLVYLLMSIVVPAANTPAEKAAASGMAATAQEFIRRARAGYYEGMKTWHDKQAHREWKRKFKQEMRGWKHGFQRQMSETGQQWQQNWSQHWGAHPPSVFGAVFLAPIFSLLLLGLVIALLYSVFSLVAHGGVFSWLLPAGVPLWVGIVALIVIFHVLSWPLKAARHACYFHGPWGSRHYSPMAGPLDGLVWLAFFVAVVWMLDHHVPQFHEWVQTLPPVIHRTMDTVQEWWNRKG